MKRQIPLDPFAEVTVELIGNEFAFSDNPFLPEPDGNPSVFILDRGAIFGTSVGQHPRRACQPPGGGGFDIFDLLDDTEPRIPAPW